MRKVKLNEVTMLKNLFSGFKSHYKENMYRTIRESLKSGSLELIKEGKSAYFEYRVIIEGGFELGDTLVQVTFAQYTDGVRR